MFFGALAGSRSDSGGKMAQPPNHYYCDKAQRPTGINCIYFNKNVPLSISQVGIFPQLCILKN